jgi:glutathionylspermidine synthase
MERRTATPRPNHAQIVQSQGLVYNDTTLPNGAVRQFWDESAYYAFSMREILQLEKATQELHDLCLQAVDHVITRRRYPELAIPEFAWPAIEESWEIDSPSIYGRFDLRYDGKGPAKLLEYNADTPTSLLEAAVIQWYWMEETNYGADQWNSIHDKLVACWQRHAPRIPNRRVHFAYTGTEESGEDLMTVTYLRETANQAGLSTHTLAVEDIGWDHDHRRFSTTDREPLTTIFKLYPWEWMFGDEFGHLAIAQRNFTQWIEPTWKCILSNKAILAILWELFPNHPNLLPAYLGSPQNLTNYAQKPILGREGANISLVTRGSTLSQPGPYGEEGYVFQQYAPLPDFDDKYPVLGTWVIDGEAAGLGIREADTLITDNQSRFVPHVVED